IYLKYHQARDPRDEGRFFSRPVPADACWLDDLPADELAVSGASAWDFRSDQRPPPTGAVEPRNLIPTY
ncbi:MAG: hypothetical protein OEW93_10800, partial [Candidatus Bathyarchaeota archaeon]|nr:hypothetical protein [Candidatus Bathyarchaeota archaeon]